MMLTDLETLVQARDLLSNPARWTQGMLAGDESNNQVAVNSLDAVCWCAIGACNKVSGNLSEHPDSLRRAAEEMRGWSPSQVNDSVGYEATLEMFDRAIEIERSK